MKYELTIVTRSSDDKPFTAHQIDKINADNLIHLCAQFNHILLSLYEREKEIEIERRVKEERKYFTGVEDDDIPF